MLIFEVLIGMFVVFVTYAAVGAFRTRPSAMTVSSAHTDSPWQALLEADVIHLEDLDLEPASSGELVVPSATR